MISTRFERVNPGRGGLVSSRSTSSAKAWIFYGDGAGNFTRAEIATGFDFHEAKVADANGDGRPDIISKPFVWKTPRIDVWLNVAPAK